MENRNGFGVVFLIIILLVFVFGGYFLMDYVTKEQPKINKEKSNLQENIKDTRLDKTKDYIYYDNEEELILSLDLYSKDAFFNLESMQEVNALLKKEHDTMKNTIKYVKDISDVDLSNAEVNDEGIYSLEYREYTDYNYEDYVSLLINDYKYDVINGVVATNTYAYVVSKNSGERITADKLLNDHLLDMDKVKEKIKKRLEDTQTISDEELTIDINATVNDLSNFAIYINKNGKLAISFIVKTNKNNYNDSIELN